MDYKTLSVLQVFITCFLVDISLQDRIPNLTDILDELFKDYDHRVPPYHFLPADNRTEIQVGLYVNEIFSVSTQEMYFKITTVLRCEWDDPRLKIDNLTNVESITLSNDMISRLWVPSVYFSNERKSKFHTTTTPNMWIQLFRGGKVFVSKRYTMDMYCQMSLEKFPFDYQHCFIKLELYSSPIEDALMVWKSENAVELPDDLSVVDFEILYITKQNCEGPANEYSTGVFSCLMVSFGLQRMITYYLTLIYVPSAFIVVISWVSFWISPFSIPARVSLGITTVLTVLSLTFLTGVALPNFPSVKAIDIWLLLCIGFVCVAFLEFAVVSVVSSSKTGEGNNETVISQNNLNEETESPASKKKKLSPQFIDNLAKCLFPALFVISNICYWAYFLRDY